MHDTRSEAPEGSGAARHPPRSRPHGSVSPSPWVVRFAARLAPGSRVLDVACGNGRHLRHLLERGCRVTGVDVDLSVVTVRPRGPLALVRCDLEGEAPWPFAPDCFDAVVVTRYLHRPLFPDLARSVAPGGILICETFARGHERLGRPRNPAFLLEQGELLRLVGNRLCILAYEEIETSRARLQRVAAWRTG